MIIPFDSSIETSDDGEIIHNTEHCILHLTKHNIRLVNIKYRLDTNKTNKMFTSVKNKPIKYVENTKAVE